PYDKSTSARSSPCFLYLSAGMSRVHTPLFSHLRFSNCGVSRLPFFPQESRALRSNQHCTKNSYRNLMVVFTITSSVIRWLRVRVRNIGHRGQLQILLQES